MPHLVPVETVERDGVTMLRLTEGHWRPRDGFALTDPGTDLAGALDQANYCIWCHNQQKDSCRTGLHEKAGGCRKTVFGVTLAGCPLAEKIPEMNLFRARGYSLGAIAIVAIDGLKIERLPAEISGVVADGNLGACEPVRDVAALYERLDARTMAGFGGVAEYGITVRWDKNFLKVVRLLLERRAQFAMYGGVRFGGTLTLDQAFEMGFDHVALALGAGKPTLLDLPSGLARGVRMASDFLMALQLTGAAKTDSIANLQLRLPAVATGRAFAATATAATS